MNFLAAERLGVYPGSYRLAFVDDTPIGIAAGLNAGTADRGRFADRQRRLGLSADGSQGLARGPNLNARLKADRRRLSPGRRLHFVIRYGGRVADAAGRP